MNLCYEPNFSEENPFLSGAECYHATKVLRLKKGDEVLVTDGKGNLFKNKIISIGKEGCQVKTISLTFVQFPPFHIHIAMGILKATDRMEWFIEKAVEIGVHQISFFYSSNCERKRINLDRFQRIAISALKQSKQVWMPKIEEIVKLKDIFSYSANEKFIGFAGKKNSSELFFSASKNKKYLVLIGPEGDFSQTEFEMAIESGFIPVSLGTTTLRTETAAMVACTFLNLINRGAQ